MPLGPPMKVTRARILLRGLACRCPNCGGGTLFAEGHLFRVNPSCPTCGLKFEKGEGTFLGPFALNYGVTAFGLVIPTVVLYATGRISSVTAFWICLAASIGGPLLLYRPSWGWWLMLYYFFLPDNLPANLNGRPEDDE